MKINNTPEALKALAKAIESTGTRLFSDKSSDAKYNAQRNLDGISHYADDGGLRFHKSRINYAHEACNGLLFVVEESCATDFHNTKRGHRCVAFDVFGNTVYRPDLDACFSSSKQAFKAFESTEIDLVEHYRKTLAEKLAWLNRDVETMQRAIDDVGAIVAIESATH